MIQPVFHSLLILLIVSLNSCKVIEFTEPDNPVSEIRLQLDSNLVIESTGGVKMNMMGLIKEDFISSSFRIFFQDKVIYIDPLHLDQPIPADLILITHPHADHFSKSDILSVIDDNTMIVAPAQTGRKLDHLVFPTTPGRSYTFESIHIEIVPAYNVKKGFFHLPLHSRKDGYSGFILNLGGKRIYHAGDTDLIPEMGQLGEIDVALIPIGTGKTAMDPTQAAAAVSLINPTYVIPMHYEPATDSLNSFIGKVGTEIQIICADIL